MGTAGYTPLHDLALAFAKVGFQAAAKAVKIAFLTRSAAGILQEIMVTVD